MRKIIGTFLIISLLGISQTGCSGRFWGGAAAGAVGTGAVYEYQKKKQMDQLDQDFESGTISREEYLRRKEEIRKGSIIY